MKTLALTLAAAMGLALAGSNAAEAGCGYSRYGFSGGYGGGFYGGHIHHNVNPYTATYGGGHLHWHDTSHLHYQPGGFVPHGNHFHYQPGGYYLHQTGHYDLHH